MAVSALACAPFRAPDVGAAGGRDLCFDDPLSACPRLWFATVAGAAECLLGSALDAVLQAAAGIDGRAGVASSGSRGRRIGVIAFDGEHSCDATRARDRFATRAIVRVRIRFDVQTRLSAPRPAVSLCTDTRHGGRRAGGKGRRRPRPVVSCFRTHRGCAWPRARATARRRSSDGGAHDVVRDSLAGTASRPW
jgi:hypothetical protein